MRIAMYQGQPYFVHQQDNKLLGARIDAANIAALIRQPHELVRQKQGAVYNEVLIPGHLQAPIRAPHQVFALAGNFTDHAQEMHLDSKVPRVFSKAISALTGPRARITLSSATVDWESELVVVIGRKLFRGNLADADKAIFGYMLGQDLTDRQQQLTGGQPLLSKSHPRFAATGPWITTVDELTDGVKNVHLETRVNGVRKQSGRLGQMTWDPVTAVHYIADSVPLLPGDLIFMGTPGGVGYAHSPKQFLKPDDFVDSIADELGVLNVSCVGTDVGFDQANRSLGVLI